MTEVSNSIVQSNGGSSDIALPTPGYTIKTREVPQMFKDILKKNPGVMNYMQSAKSAIDNFVSSNENAINRGVKTSGIAIDGYVINSSLDGYDKRKLVVLVGSLKGQKETKTFNGVTCVECPVSYFPRTDDDDVLHALAYITYLVGAKNDIPKEFTNEGIDAMKLPKSFLSVDQQKKLVPGLVVSNNKVSPDEKVKVVAKLKEKVEAVIKGGGRKVFDTIKEIQKRGEEINKTVLLTNLSCIKISVPKTLVVGSGEFVKIGGLKMTHTYVIDGEKFPSYNSFGASTVTPITQINLEDFFYACVAGGSYIRYLKHESDNKKSSAQDPEEKKFKLESVEGSKMLYIRPFDQEFLFYAMTQPNQLLLYYTKPRIDDEVNNLTMVYRNDAATAKITGAKAVFHKINNTIISGFQWKKPVLKVVGNKLIKNEECGQENLEVISVRVDMWESDLQFLCIEDPEIYKRLGQLIIERFEGLLLVTPNRSKTTERQNSMEKVLSTPSGAAKEVKQHAAQDDYEALLTGDDYAEDQQSQLQTSTDGINSSSQDTLNIMDLKIPTVATATFHFDMMSVVTDMRIVYQEIGIPISLDGVFSIVPNNFKLGANVDKNAKDYRDRLRDALDKERRVYRFNSHLHSKNFHNRPNPSVICINEYQGTLGALEDNYKFVVVSNSEIFSGKENISQIAEEHGHFLFTTDYTNASSSDDALKKFWDQKKIPQNAAVRSIRMKVGDTKYVFALRKMEKSNLESSVKLMREKLFDFPFEATNGTAAVVNTNSSRHSESDTNNDTKLQVMEVEEQNGQSDPAVDAPNFTVTYPEDEAIDDSALGDMDLLPAEETMDTPISDNKKKDKRKLDDIDHPVSQKGSKKKKTT